jgi:hypothetical protein
MLYTKGTALASAVPCLPRTNVLGLKFLHFSKARRLPVPLQCYASDWIRTGFVSGHGFQPFRNNKERNRALAPGDGEP